MAKTKRTKAWTEMNQAELAEATAEFDKEFVADTFRPMTPAEKARWERVRKKRGRPRQGRGAEVISVSIERGLLDRCDSLARKNRLTRAGLIARGIKALLAAHGAE